MSLDLNVVLMDYDKDAGFGTKSRIDIWWRTTEYNGNLALMLLKFLWLSDNWRNAKARILIVNPVNEQREAIQRNTGTLLESMRINAEVKVINNEIEKRSFYDIVQVESVNSDLIMLSLPEIKAGNEAQFVDETNNLCKDIGTVLLIKASTNFKKLRIGVRRTLLGQLMKRNTAGKPVRKTTLPETATITYPEKPEIAKYLRLLVHDLTPELIINAAAYTQVDAAEIESAKALQLNYMAVATLGKVAQDLHIPIIHYSTGYISVIHNVAMF
jgi:hypothetical protein